MADNLPALVDKAGLPLKKGRIRPALATAIRLIVAEGYTVRDAAKAVGYTTHGLTQAFRKPHVKAFRADVRRAWMNSQTEKAWLGVASLASSAKSEDVRLKAARTILEAAGELAQNDRAPASTAPLINIGQAHVHVHPPTERLPGVIEAVPYKVIDDDR